ncbi:formin-like protein 5 isoform X2 [Pistacia vera]|uniref:formin-like protein 5 isoform X2 n=1 Tax=Pistacia vera TaxID=55513 RepID=UPI0012631468|nr:formin-like protein 5 isoform X2 [Pistacia vera]
MIVKMIQEQMGVMRAGCYIFLVVLLCGSLMVTSEYMTTSEEMFLSRLVNPETGEVDNVMAELLWISCREHLIHLEEVVEDLNLCLPEETPGSTNEMKSTSQPLTKGNIQKWKTVLHPCLKQTLLQCIRKDNLLFHVSREGGSWYTRYLEFLLPRPGAPRQKLGPQSRRRIAETIADAPGPSLALALAPAPAPALALAPAPAPGSMPSLVSKPSPPPPSSSTAFFPVDSSPPPVVDGSTNSSSGGNINADKNINSRKTIIVAVVVTAAVTFFLAALLFFCCRRLRNGGDRRNDERPLLSVSMSDYSVGNSIKGEKLGHQSLDGKFAALEAIGGTTKSSADSLDTSSNINGQVLPPLKPPPGRPGATPLGMPALKPPPGRAEPLPPEPPASLRPPAPPRPPPPIKSSESTGPPAPKPAPPPPPPMAPGVRPGPPPPPPPMASGMKPGAPPPPIPKGGPAPPRPPPPMPMGLKAPRPPLGSKHPSSSEGAGTEGDGDAPKTKLKPFFWDKVLANPDNSMVWHQIKSGSFQFNEEMIESLFGYAPNDKKKNEGKRESSFLDQGPQYIQIIDPKKAQNLAIMLRALNVTMEEVRDALLEGNELPVELLQTLLKMAPTADEELKLRLFNGELSQLGPAERFLKALVDIPYAFKRMEALLFMCSLQEEVTTTKESFETLEVACKELRNSRLFLKLLEAVLKTGNRMNDGTFRGGAQAFKLDTLLKLSDVKGVDGKTTLLHFVVQEIIRSEGIKAARAARESKSSNSFKTDDLQEISCDDEVRYRSLGLQVVSNLSSELENVKKAASIDADNLTGTVAKLGHSLLKSRDFLNSDMKNSEEISGFHETLKSFVQNAEVDVMWLLEEEKRIINLVKSTADYFHGKAGKDEGIRLFIIVRDFLIILDKACKEVSEAQKRSAKTPKKEGSTGSSSSDPGQQPSPDLRQWLFPAIAERRMNDSSSDEEK